MAAILSQPQYLIPTSTNYKLWVLQKSQSQINRRWSFWQSPRTFDNINLYAGYEIKKEY